MSCLGRWVFRAMLGLLAPLLLVAPARAATASWSFEPSSWDFGLRLPSAGPSAPKAFTLTNTGEVELRPVFISVAGAVGAGFELVEGGCGSLAPGAHCDIEITFNPTSAGPKRGELAASTGQTDVPEAKAELSGTGAGPATSIAPATLSFAGRQVGTSPSPAETVTLGNSGQLDLSISSLSIESNQVINLPGAAQEQFRISGGSCAPGLVLPPEAACDIGVTFSPGLSGIATASLLIADNAPGSPQRVALEGPGESVPSTQRISPTAAPGPARSVRWGYAGKVGRRTVLVRMNVPICDGVPTLRPQVRERPRSTAITMVARFPASGQVGDCEKSREERTQRVKLNRPLSGLALYDGSLSPPSLRVKFPVS